MCGISGLVLRKNTLGHPSLMDDWDDAKSWNQSNNKYDYVENIVKGMLLTSAMRGTDSTGIISVHKEDVIIEKMATDPLSFMETPNFTRCMMNTFRDDIGFIGHTRSATIGKIGRMTAHPHDFDNVVGVHNGTLTDWTTLYKNAVSDSHAIFGALNTAEVPTEVLKRLSGSYALVWYDKITGMYYFARNSERPLSYVHSPEGLFFASEWVMLRYSMERALGTKGYKELMGGSVVENFKENTLYAFDPHTLEFTMEKYEKEVKSYPMSTTGSGKPDPIIEEERKLKAGIIFELGLVPGRSYPIFLTSFSEYTNGNSSTGSCAGTIYGYFKNFTNNEYYYFAVYGVNNVREKYEQITMDLLLNDNAYCWGEFDYLMLRPVLSSTTIKIDQEYIPVQCVTTADDVKKAAVLCFKSHSLTVAEAA